ncbi:hypothetical protein E2562_034697 [Oryza meyeriana var. granulata]|uniref:Uncharacterized protein n=1 Tax=Oryza meyeriana var. granulata TaxID=110450 RepID=A0A6G1C1L0_9ORYZ|nr:hypothetical protein E2562_034697 [Oryza meyeriana var. granulata]
MAGGGGGRGRGGVRAASPAGDLGKGGLPEWLRIYDGIVAMLRKTQAQAEELAAERDHLAAFVKIQHEFWVSRVQSALQQTRRADAIRRRYEAANMELLLGDKEREARCYQKLAELTEDDLDNFRTSITALATENYELKVKLNEVESHAELNENTVDHIHSPRDLRAEIKKLKQAYMTLSSKKDKEVSALRAEKDFVWNQLRTMEKDYTDILKKKNIEAAQATEAAQKLQKSLEELQDQNKDNGIGRLQAEAVDAKNKILILEDKLQEMLSLVKDKDLEIEKLKHGQDRTRSAAVFCFRKAASESPCISSSSAIALLPKFPGSKNEDPNSSIARSPLQEPLLSTQAPCTQPAAAVGKT